MPIGNLFKITQIIKAAAEISGCREIGVIGSSVYYFYKDETPHDYDYSYEVDIYQRDGNQKGLDEIEGSLGEMSRYHQTHLIYAHCLSPKTATMPENWYSRAEEYEINLSNDEKLTVYYPIPADLAISKLCANREKDILFVTMLLKTGIVTSKEIEQYISEIQNTKKQSICKTNLRVCNANVLKTKMPKAF